MTALNLALNNWAFTVSGKVTRVVLAGLGMVLGTALLVASVAAGRTAWGFIALGVLTTLSLVRAAHWPTVDRLGVAAVSLALIPFLLPLS